MSHKPQSRPIEESLALKEQGFDYTSLDTKSRAVVQECANEIRNLIKRTAQDVIDIGQKLIEAKEQLGHGQFEDWLRTEFNWGQWTARKFMQVARQFKSVNFTDLSIDTSALYLLAAPSTPEMVRQEALERARQGEAITNSKVKTIASQYKKPAECDLSKPFTVLAENIEPEAFTPPTLHPEAQSIKAENAAVVEQYKNLPLDKKVEGSAYLQVDDYPLDIDLVTDVSDSSPRYQQEKEVQQLFRVGHLLCIEDFKQEEGYKWFGHVAEVKEMSSDDIEVVIRISLQSAIK